MASEIKVDTISEKTSANGVTIDSVSLKDGKVATANSIDSDAYVDGSIDNAHIADDAIDSEHYAAGSIDTAHIADDQITLAKMAAGTDGNIISYDASGDPVAIATGNDGQLLTSTGAGSPPAFEDAPAGGLSAASQWRVTANFTGDAAPIASNWEEADAPTSFGILGSSMTESSGVFTFPSTGYWLITAQVEWQSNNDGNYNSVAIYTTHDNSTYAEAAECKDVSGKSGTYYSGIHCSYIFDVTSTSNCKCAMYLYQQVDANTTLGGTDSHKTGLTFIKLGDT